MKLVKLTVEHFQCIDSAEVEFGPGLNVLFGPNDLGKSSLAWAIRAVLLMQHGAAAHQRFVSWYGGGAPTVTLAFTDGEAKQWRVSKTFGGSAGRSVLESTRDGKTYRTEAQGRQVDEKLRQLLGWGITAPGGTRGASGIPESFLSQVLLAEQDNVRKVLFESTLEKDQDDTGRQQLTQALGALAQDPLFKRVLDDAQGRVDLAFTPKGNRKRSAGSPFVAITAKVTDYEREVAELADKLKETQAAEQRIQELIRDRDRARARLGDAERALAELTRRGAVAAQQAELCAQVAAERAKLDAVAEQQRTRDAAEASLKSQRARVAASEREGVAAKAALEVAEAARQAAAKQVAALGDPQDPGELRRQELEQAHTAATAAANDASRVAERAAEALRLAEHYARAVNEARAALAKAQHDERTAVALVEAATGPAQDAKAALDTAQQTLRDARSADAVRVRELRVSELTTRKLVREAELDRARALVQEAAALREVTAKRDAAAMRLTELTAELARTSAALHANQVEQQRVEGSRKELEAVEQFGWLVNLRSSAADARALLAAADVLAAEAVALRTRETALRAQVRADLPIASRLAELRGVRDAMRIAEAKLGGGLSIVVRPKAAVHVTTRVDGGSEQSSHATEVLTLSALRRLELEIADLVTVEITAGEASARTAANAARAAWEADGAAVLRALQLETLEVLEALRAASDAALLQADDLRRQADQADAQAQQRRGTVQMESFTSEIARMEQELGPFEEAVMQSRLALHGAEWAPHLKQALRTLDAAGATLATAHDALRTDRARLEVQLENQRGVVGELTSEVTRRDVGWGAAAGERERQATQEVEAATADVAAIAAQRKALEGAADTAEHIARTAVAVAEATSRAAEARVEIARQGALKARDAAVQAETRRDQAHAVATGHDADGVWRDALMTGATLVADGWRTAATSAAAAHAASQAQVADLARTLEGLRKARVEAVSAARLANERAERTAATARSAHDESAVAHAALVQDISALQVAVAEATTALATVNADGVAAAIARLSGDLAALGPTVPVVPPEQAAAAHQELETLKAEELELQEQFLRARGGLEQVGGAVVREHHRELQDALAAAKAVELDVFREYDAWKLLVATLHESESTQGAHLGRALAAPVSEQFRALTGGRYGQLELGPHLQAEGLGVAGEAREFSALSAGTQDQLATLLRLCIAQRLRSSIVLDDHLSQSDPAKVEWFNGVLRGAAQDIQIILITCRPGEVLGDGEWPKGTEASLSGAAGFMRAVDLSKLIRRIDQRA